MENIFDEKSIWPTFEKTYAEYILSFRINIKTLRHIFTKIDLEDFKINSLDYK